MLEILQTINSFIWNILGVIVGIPILFAIGFSTILCIFALIIRLLINRG